MKIKFLPQDVEFEIEPDQSIMELAHENKVFIKSVCNGMPSCAECRVKVVEGEHNVFPPSAKELSLIGTGYYIDQRRLSCQLKCFGDVVVDLAEQADKEVTDQQRRPQGNLRKEESEVSRAVMGNLIEQEDTLLKEVGTEVKTRSHGSRNRGDRKSRVKDNRGEGDRGGRNRNRNRNRNKSRNRNRNAKKD